jgi:hypothetical protein
MFGNLRNKWQFIKGKRILGSRFRGSGVQGFVRLQLLGKFQNNPER